MTDESMRNCLFLKLVGENLEYEKKNKKKN